MKHGPSKNKFAISALIGTAGGGQPTLIHYTCTVKPSQIFRARKDLWHMQPCRSRVKCGMMGRWKMCWWRRLNQKFHQHQQLLPELHGGLAAPAQSEADGQWSQLAWVTLGNKQFSSWAACFFVFKQHFPKGICFEILCIACRVPWYEFPTYYICIYIYLLLYICMFYLYIYCTYIHIQIYYTYIHV